MEGILATCGVCSYSILIISSCSVMVSRFTCLHLVTHTWSYPSSSRLPTTFTSPSARLRSRSMIVPIYQSEISPANHRGKLACIEFTGNIIGYASSIWIDYACSFITSDLSWRVPLGIQCIGGAVLAVGTWVTPESPRCVLVPFSFLFPLPSLHNFPSLPICPNSSYLSANDLLPLRYLIDKDLDDEGLRVIADFGSGGNMDDPLARAEFTEIKEAILADVRSSSSFQSLALLLPIIVVGISFSCQPDRRLGSQLILVVFAACRRG